MKKNLAFESLVVLTVILLVIYVYACKREPINYPGELNYSYQNDTLFEPLTTAIEIAENIDKSNIISEISGKSTIKSGSNFVKRKIKNNITIYDKEMQNPYFYVINYELGGYTIISADKRLIPVLGYSDQGFLKLDSLPMGLVRWFGTNASYMKYLRNSNATPSMEVSYQWANLQCPVAKGTQCPPPIPPEYSETTVTIGPLLQTTWDQGCGYNSACPVDNNPNNIIYDCGHCYAGCVATAMAQVMNYWKYPTSYTYLSTNYTNNWNSMPNNYATPQIATFMANIGSAVGMNYGGYPSGSGAAATAIPGALKNIFHYSTADYGSYNYMSYNTVLNNLNSNRPVLFSGCSNESVNLLGQVTALWNCHEWVCDGYMQITDYHNGVETAQYLLFDMNWGWSGNCNGWYYFNQWNPTPNPPNAGFNFQYADGIVCNIHP
jgi:hypothetical protein